MKGISRKTMHPPLDRPHPECQEQIEALRHCQTTRPAWKVWACNELKFRLDTCFRKEKEAVLKELNKDIVEKRREEDEQSALSTGRNMSFQEFLKRDAEYQKEMEEVKEGKKSASWF